MAPDPTACSCDLSQEALDKGGKTSTTPFAIAHQLGTGANRLLVAEIQLLCSFAKKAANFLLFGIVGGSFKDGRRAIK